MERLAQIRILKHAFPISVFLGLLIWFLDALIDYFFFYTGHSTFLGLLLTDIPPHEIYIRSSALIIFVLFGAFVSYFIQQYETAETRLENVFNNVIPICITDTEFNIIDANTSYREIFGPVKENETPIKCYDSRPGSKCNTPECPLNIIIREDEKIYTCEAIKKEKDGTLRYFVVNATPYLDADNNLLGIIETFQDITPRRLLEKEQQKLIEQLQAAMEEVKTLSGFLPICSSCKKIRDDKGYWNQIESYIKDHSEAEFSHSICPDCAKELYSDYLEKK